MKKRSYYEYNNIGALGGSYPFGRKLFNTNQNELTPLYHEFNEFEAPVTFDETVRKVNYLGVYYTDTLRSYFEKTYFGQNAAMIDANGWYFQNEYDNNGRIKYSWLPFDFPQCNEGALDIVEMNVPVFNKLTKEVTASDIVDYTHNTVTRSPNTTTTTTNQDLMVGKVVSAQTPNANLQISGSLEQRIIEHSVSFEYRATAGDPFHNLSTLQQALLKFAYAGRYTDDCMMIKISTDRFGFQRTLLIGCPAMENMPGDLSCPGTPAYPEVSIDLAEIKNQMGSLNPGETLKFTIESLGEGGHIELVDIAEDHQPRIVVRKIGCDPHKDYTTAFVYNDSARTTVSSSKIDDGLHTNSKGWQKTYPNKDGRYTGSKNYFGVNNVMLRSDLMIGSPVSPYRVDSVVSFHSGFLNLVKVKDQYQIETTSNYYDNGEIYSSYNSDMTHKEFQSGFYQDTLKGETNYGCVFVSKYRNENGIWNFEYYDAMKNLRRKVVAAPYDTVTTLYNYDLLGNITSVIDPYGAATHYIYDDFYRIKYKVNVNIDTIAYRHDKAGRLRFTQDAGQKRKNALSYTEFDDLGRIMVAGEAMIDTLLCDYRNNPLWLPDVLNPDVLNFTGYNPATDIPTVNRMVYKSSSVVSPTFWSSASLMSTMAFPRYDDTLDNIKQGPYLMHPVNYYNFNSNVTAGPGAFEGVNQYPHFVRVLNYYDEFPQLKGSIWKYMPVKSTWDALSPLYEWSVGGRTAQNLKGRRSAVAYRDNAGEPFHYVVFSYDPRGRMEAIIRYTENLGFDGVYYTYNSMNQVLKVRVVDPLRQYVSWYGYDNNGRVDSVWTLVKTGGFGVSLPSIPDCPARPDSADIIYTYNKRGSVDTIRFTPAHIVQTFTYNSRGWIDSMVAKNNYSELLFRQAFTRDNIGNILQQVSQHKGRPQMIENYKYDSLFRLTRWTLGSDTTQYWCDKKGNRRTQSDNGTPTSYTYDWAENTDRLIRVTRLNETKNYTYNPTGAVTQITSLTNGDSTLRENFSYTAGGRIKVYTKKKYGADGYNCGISPFTRSLDNSYSWSYRYSPLGDREQKRELYSPKGDSLCGESRNHLDWTYYLLGAGGEQLAVYKGIQVANTDTSGNSGRRVYFYAHSYITSGGILVTLPDSTKQFSVMDNLGSARAICAVKNANVSFEYINYKPFGDTLNATKESLIGYHGKERDRESRLGDFGVRKYDDNLGRFTSIDPLWEKYPAWSPYHYCRNNPLVAVDGSGMLVFVLNSTDQEVLQKAVESKYEKYVGFDENGKVIINMTEEQIENVLSKDKNSNMAALIQLAQDENKKFYVEGVEQDTKFKYTWDNDKYEGGWYPETCLKDCLTDFHNVWLDGTVYGVFLSATLTYGKSGDKQPVSLTDYSRALYDKKPANGLAPEQALAHELLLHGLQYLKGIPLNHDAQNRVEKRAIK